MCFSYNHRVFPSLVIVVTISFLRVHSSKIDADILSLSPPQLDIWSKSNYQVFQKVSFPFCFFLKRLLGKCDDFEVEILVLKWSPGHSFISADINAVVFPNSSCQEKTVIYKIVYSLLIKLYCPYGRDLYLAHFYNCSIMANTWSKKYD